MKKYLLILGLVVAFFVTTNYAYALTTYQVTQGGTGRATFTSGQLLYGNGTNALSSTATTSVTCAGTINCTTFTAIGPSPITLTGTGSISTSTALTAGQVAVATGVNTIGSYASFLFDSVLAKLTVTNASTTALSATGAGTVGSPSVIVGTAGNTGIYQAGTNTLGLTNGVSGISWNGTAFYPNTSAVRDLGIVSTNEWRNLFTTNASTTALSISGLTSALTQVGADGTLAEYAGTTCTNQFVRALSALGIATCASVSLTADVTGVLPIANGGTNNSSAYTAGSVVFSNGTSLTQDNTNFFWDDTNNRLGIGETSPGTYGTLEIKSAAAASTLAPGNIGLVDSTAQAAGTGGMAVFSGKYTDGGAYTTAGWIRASKTNGTTGNYGFDMTFGTRLDGSASMTERMRITSAGLVGIGDTSPDAKLDILQASDVATEGLQISRSNDTDYMRLYMSAGLGGLSDTLIFSSAFAGDVAAIGRDGSAYFAGNVGIGNTSPGSKLTVTGDIAIPLQANNFIGASATNGILFDGTGNYNLSTQSALGLANIFDADNNGSGTFFIGKGATDPDSATHIIDISNAGNVGIAEGNAPTQALSIYRAGATAAYTSYGNSAVGLNGTLFGIDASSNTVISNTAAFPILLSTNGVERMRILSGGNVGIGTTTPLSKLQVSTSGADAFSLDLLTGSSHDTGIRIGRGSGANGAGIQMVTAATDYLSFYVNGSALPAINTAAQMVLTEGGNVGIGTTTPGTLLSLGDTTNYINLSNTATSTFAFGINLKGGCFAVNGTCITGGAGGTPGGADTQVQFNDAGAFGGESGFTYTKTLGQFSIPSNGWYGIGGNLLGYASSTNAATIWGLSAGGQSATTSATVRGTTAFGYQALSATAASTGNSAFGYQAGAGLTSGDTSTFIGYEAGERATSTGSNTYVGYRAGLGGAGSHTYSSLGGNTAVGTSALDAITTGYRNVSIGSGAHGALTTGDSNIAIGYVASSNLTTGTDNVSLGNNSSLPSATDNGQLNIQNIIYGTGNTGSGTTVSTGRISVGTTTPSAKFTVWGGGATAATTAFQVANSASTTLMIINNAGNIGVATSTPWRTFSVTGTMANTGMTTATGGTNNDICITAAGDFVNESTGTCVVSSRKFKHDIETLDIDAIAIVQTLSPSSFVMNGEYTLKYGFIAEEAYDADPRLALKGSKGEVRSLDDHAFIAVLWSAVQEIITHQREQDAKIAELEARLDALEGGKKQVMCVYHK